MCGIVGFVDTSLPSSDFLRSTGSILSSALEHRGPDHKDIWVDENFGISLGHTRLSIIDLTSNGSQPMVSHSGRFIIIFNGEIYNHFEIRKRIEIKNSSKKWRGYSDTETLIEAIENYGIRKTLKLCIGMFSFAIWDRKEKVMHLARDRFGEKPLYWGKIKTRIDNKSIFIFSSELSSIWNFPESVKEVEDQAINTYFNFGYVKPPLSIQKGIYQLLPGEYISIPFENLNFNEENPPKAEKWWDSLDEFINLDRKDFQEMNEKNIIDGLELILEKAINLQSNADVPLGAFLSGGIDSSLIATLLQKKSINKIKTFNVSFPDIKGNESIIDEGPIAKSIANHIGTDHIEIALREKESLEIIKDISSYFSEPFADSSQVPSFLVCKEAKKIGLSVAMSGDGGDELFGGYNRHTLIPKLHNLFSKIPNEVIDKFILPNIDNRFFEYLISKEKSQKLYSSIKSSKDTDRMYADLTMTGLSNLYKITKNDFNYLNNYPKKYQQIKNLSEKVMLKDLTTYLPFDILVKMDRASMANSLETRAPFLDHRVVEYAWKIPIKQKISQSIFSNSGKLPLKKILYKYFPKKTFDRKKNGFSMPLNSWLKGPLKSWADDILNPSEIKNQGYINQNIVRQVWDDHIDGKMDNSNKLWTILMWQEWIRKWQK